jgi:hypothetical protein
MIYEVNIMKIINKLILIFLFAAIVVSMGCNSEKKTAFCGCPKAVRG